MSGLYDQTKPHNIAVRFQLRSVLAPSSSISYFRMPFVIEISEPRNVFMFCFFWVFRFNYPHAPRELPFQRLSRLVYSQTQLVIVALNAVPSRPSIDAIDTRHLHSAIVPMSISKGTNVAMANTWPMLQRRSFPHGLIASARRTAIEVKVPKSSHMIAQQRSTFRARAIFPYLLRALERSRCTSSLAGP